MVDINRILKNSTAATCGVMEKEITVPREQVSKVMQTLRNKGYMIIGKSVGKGKTVKIWFIIRGGF